MTKKTTTNITTIPLVKTIVNAIQDKKGQDITLIDLRGMEGAIAQCFIVCQGSSPTQVEAIASEVSDQVREALREKAIGCVGLEQAHWVAIDFADVILHIFVPDMRQYYDIEGLWQDAPQTQIPNLD